jgi:signal transduction histidine kinase
MTRLLELVPLSSATAYPRPTSPFQESDEQIFNHWMPNPPFCHTENQTVSKQSSATEDNFKMDKLQLELEALKFFGTGIAHDLGNVLTVIVGNVELARFPQHSAQAQSELRQALDEMEEAVKMAKALHLQLHQLFQGTTVQKESVVLEELVERATRLGLAGSSPGVKCHLKFSQQLPSVQLDSCQISQVIENLVLNAVQALGDKGQIEVAARAVELTEDQVPGLKAGHYVELKVSDTGPGIAPEHLSMIFAPHFTTKAKGQGLGLALCFSIIKHHHGHIQVESQLGVGTTFQVWLPSAEL